MPNGCAGQRESGGAVKRFDPMDTIHEDAPLEPPMCKAQKHRDFNNPHRVESSEEPDPELSAASPIRQQPTKRKPAARRSGPGRCAAQPGSSPPKMNLHTHPAKMNKHTHPTLSVDAQG